MANWLNLALAGDVTYTVSRDGVVVTDLEAAGASLSTVAGAVTLTTPDDESHDWAVTVQANYLPTAVPIRMRAFSLTHPAGITAAEAGSGAETIDLTVNEPSATPDPATFTTPATAAFLIVEETP